MNENKATTSAVMALEQSRRIAMVEADIATLESLFSEDLQWIHASGRPESKAMLLASIQSRKIEFESIGCTDEAVRAYGETVLVSGIANIKARIADESRMFRNRFTIVWVRMGTHWQAVNWQSTSLPS